MWDLFKGDLSTNIGLLLSALGVLLTVFGLYLTIRAEHKARAAESIDWIQLQCGSKYLARQLKNKGFLPDVLFTPGQRGGIIAHLISDHLDKEIPIITGFALDQSVPVDPAIKKYGDLLETSRWHVLIPHTIKPYSSQKILIVDDWTVSGEFMKRIRELLITYGYKPENIRTCCIAATSLAIHGKTAPDLYWKKVDWDHCYFPWGEGK